MPARSQPCIAIVGGGFSGTLVATQILMRARHAFRTCLVERGASVGPGVAYRTRLPQHLLNVPAKSMSALAGDPEHFIRWLRNSGREAATRWNAVADPDAFLPRGLYGEYVSSLLKAAESEAVGGVSFERVEGEVARVDPRRTGGRIAMADGRTLEADKVVLAIGNPAPAHPTVEALPFYESERYVRDPWSDRALQGVGPDEAVMIVGSNLTMIDVAVALAERRHRGAIHVLSRHGLVPPEHRKAGGAAAPLDVDSLPPSTRLILRSARDSARRAARERLDWRPGFDTLRPHVARIWFGLSRREQNRFLRHARPFWEIHRHRAAPDNMRDIERMRETGQLAVRAGRVQEISERRTGTKGARIKVSIRPRGENQSAIIEVDRVINATGPEVDYRRAGSPLVDALMRDGLVSPGPHGLGLDATPDGTLLEGSGRPSPFLCSLGPPLRGVLWETTAVPEIREQAASLAQRLLAQRAVD